MTSPPPTYTHGTTSGYHSGCRCNDCRNANNLYQRNRNEWKQRKNRETENATYWRNQIPPYTITHCHDCNTWWTTLTNNPDTWLARLAREKWHNGHNTETTAP